LHLDGGEPGLTFIKNNFMKLKFYGTRGSSPICDAGFQQFGGNTTCLQITDTNQIAIIDAGTGLRNLGRDPRAIGHKQEQIRIAFTHFHWNHIQGFPFFAPAYDPKQKITLLTLGRDQTVSNLREIFEVQMQAEYFPVQLDHMGANFEFLQIADASKHFTGINNVETVVTAQRHNHPGGAYSFRIERNGKVLVVCTDVEHGGQIDPQLVELARGADLLVHDAQYTAEELQKRRGWGHSSFDQAMQLAEMAGVKHLAPHASRPGPRRRVSWAHRKIVSTCRAKRSRSSPIQKGLNDLGRNSALQRMSKVQYLKNALTA
jgi:phosphoribosyl 1,2-cyclic phosphodiesterase